MRADTWDSAAHYCSECGRRAEDHHSLCYSGESEPHTHGLPLCCPGCLCLSFEEAHPEAVGTPIDDSGLPHPIVTVLQRGGYHTVESVTGADIRELRHLRGIGPRRWFALLGFWLDAAGSAAAQGRAEQPVGESGKSSEPSNIGMKS